MEDPASSVFTEMDSTMDKVVKLIYTSCDPENTNCVRVSMLIEVVKPYMPDNSCELRNLKERLDPEGVDPGISSEFFYDIMSQWTSRIKENISEENEEMGDKDSLPFVQSTPRSSMKYHELVKSCSEILNLSNASFCYENSEGNNTISHEKAILEERIKQLQHEVFKTTNELELIKQQLASAEEQNEMLVADFTRATKNLHSEQHINEQLRKNLVDIEEVKEEASSAKRRVVQLEKAMANFEKDRQNFAIEVKNLESEKLSLEEKLETARKREQDFRKELIELKDDINLKESEISTMVQLTAKLRAQLEEKDDLVRYFENETELLKHKTFTMEKKLKENYTTKTESFLNQIISDKESKSSVNKSSSLIMIKNSNHSLSEPDPQINGTHSHPVIGNINNDNLTFNSPKLLDQLAHPVSPTLNSSGSSKNDSPPAADACPALTRANNDDDDKSLEQGDRRDRNHPLVDGSSRKGSPISCTALTRADNRGFSKSDHQSPQIRAECSNSLLRQVLLRNASTPKDESSCVNFEIVDDFNDSNDKNSPHRAAKEMIPNSSLGSGAGNLSGEQQNGANTKQKLENGEFQGIRMEQEQQTDFIGSLVNGKSLDQNDISDYSDDPDTNEPYKSLQDNLFEMMNNHAGEIQITYDVIPEYGTVDFVRKPMTNESQEISENDQSENQKSLQDELREFSDQHQKWDSSSKIRDQVILQMQIEQQEAVIADLNSLVVQQRKQIEDLEIFKEKFENLQTSFTKREDLARNLSDINRELNEHLAKERQKYAGLEVEQQKLLNDYEELKLMCLQLEVDVCELTPYKQDFLDLREKLEDKFLEDVSDKNKIIQDLQLKLELSDSNRAKLKAISQEIEEKNQILQKLELKLRNSENLVAGCQKQLFEIFQKICSLKIVAESDETRFSYSENFCENLNQICLLIDLFAEKEDSSRANMQATLLEILEKNGVLQNYELKLNRNEDFMVNCGRKLFEIFEKIRNLKMSTESDETRFTYSEDFYESLSELGRFIDLIAEYKMFPSDSIRANVSQGFQEQNRTSQNYELRLRSTEDFVAKCQKKLLAIFEKIHSLKMCAKGDEKFFHSDDLCENLNDLSLLVDLIAENRENPSDSSRMSLETTLEISQRTPRKPLNFDKQRIKTEKLQSKCDDLENDLNKERHININLYVRIKLLEEENAKLKSEIKNLNLDKNSLEKLLTENLFLEDENKVLLDENRALLSTQKKFEENLIEMGVLKSTVENLRLEKAQLCQNLERFRNVKLLEKPDNSVVSTFDSDVITSEVGMIIDEKNEEIRKLRSELQENAQIPTEVASFLIAAGGDLEGLFTDPSSIKEICLNQPNTVLNNLLDELAKIENRQFSTLLNKNMHRLKLQIKVASELAKMQLFTSEMRNKSNFSLSPGDGQEVKHPGGGDQGILQTLAQSFSDGFASCSSNSCPSSPEVGDVSSSQECSLQQSDWFLEDLELDSYNKSANRSSLSRKEMEEKFTVLALMLTVDFTTLTERQTKQQTRYCQLVKKHRNYLNTALGILRNFAGASRPADILRHIRSVITCLELMDQINEDVLKSAEKCGILQCEIRTKKCWNLVINYVAVLSEDKKKNRHDKSDDDDEDEADGNLDEGSFLLLDNNSCGDGNSTNHENGSVVKNMFSKDHCRAGRFKKKIFQNISRVFLLILVCSFILIFFVNWQCTMVQRKNEICPLEWFGNLIVEKRKSGIIF